MSLNGACCAQHNLVHISVGDLLRAEVAASTPAGKQAREYMESGRLVPNEVCTLSTANIGRILICRSDYYTSSVLVEDGICKCM